MTSEYIKNCTPLELVFLESEPPRTSDLCVAESEFTFNDDCEKVYLFEGGVGVEDFQTGLIDVDGQKTRSSEGVEEIIGLVGNDDETMESFATGKIRDGEIDIALKDDVYDEKNRVVGDEDKDLMDGLEETECDLPENKITFDMLCVLIPGYRTLYPSLKREKLEKELAKKQQKEMDDFQRIWEEEQKEKEQNLKSLLLH